MASEWEVKTIAECAAPGAYSTQIGPFGKALMASEYTKSGVPVLRGTNVNHGRFYDEDFVFINQITADRLSKYESFPGDVLLVHKGTLGKIGIMPSKRKYDRYIMGNSMLRVQCDRNKLLPEFLYYWLISDDGQHYLFSRVSQVGVPQIQTPLTTLRQASLPVPPIEEQEAITQVLGALDDRIELIQQADEAIEKLARAIFKSWFVDFDPVRAKAEGREPEGIDAATAALFPREFASSELGPIPKGWTVERLSQLIEVTKGKSYKSDDLEESHTTALVTLKSFLRGGGFSIDGFKPYSGAYKKNQILEDGDIVVAYTDVTQAGLVIGRPAMVTKVLQYDILVASLDVGIVRTSPERNVPSRFIYGLLQQERFHDHVSGYTSGTTVLHLAKNAVQDFLAVVPGGVLMSHYESVASPLYERVRSNVRLSQTLSDLRDTLLPRLISGRLRVPEAEKLVEAVL